MRSSLVAASIGLIAATLRGESLLAQRADDASQVTDDIVPVQPAWNPAGDASLWTVKAGTVILQRARPQSRSIANTPTGVTILNADDYSFKWVAGPDISLVRQVSSVGSLEVRYFDIDGWQSSVSGFIPPFFEAPRIPFDSTYQSRLFSTEVNLRQRSSSVDWLTWLAGFRWVEVSESLVILPGVNSNQTHLGYSTLNQLYGGQIGADVQLWSGGPLRFDCVCKAGLYGNAASNQLNVTQLFGTPPRASDARGQVAFIGDIGLGAVYQWSDRVALRGGYQLLWIDGVAVAGDQPLATNVVAQQGIDSGGAIFDHGVTTTLNVTW